MEMTFKVVASELKKEGKSNEKLASKKDSLQMAVANIKAEIAKIGFSEAEFEALEEEKTDLQSSVAELTGRVNTLEAQLKGRLDFQYSDPVLGFDRSKVKGLVAKLIKVKDSKHAVALEVVAGGKLFQVVVDDNIVGKSLLERGKLKKRVTFIPLNKIQPRHVSASAAKCAEQIAQSLNTTAMPAIELVGFDEEVRVAIEYILGSSIVVDSVEAASQIRDATKTRTVTLDGDVYDPNGTLTGGSSDSLGATLVRLTELAESAKELEMKKALLNQVTSKVKDLKMQSSQYDKLRLKLELAEAELEAASKHLSQTNYGMLIEKRDTFTADVASAEEEIVLMTKEKDDKWNLYQELKEQETELTQQREGRLSEIGRAVQDAKIAATETSKMAREAKSRSQTLLLELESLKAEARAADEAVRNAQKMVVDAMQNEADSQMQVGEIQASYEEARLELEELEKNIADYSADVVDMKRAKSDLVKLLEAAKLESKKLSVGITRIRKDRNDAEKAVAAMLKNYSWIESEMSAFGVRGGDYDFEATDPNEVSQLLKELKSEQDSLVRSGFSTAPDAFATAHVSFFPV
jgi:structural maintenance of chromosome 2